MLAWLEQKAFIVIAVAGALVLGASASTELLRSNQAPVLVIREDSMAAGSPIRVHVAGAVAQPGVYTLTMGDRVEDALLAAGGAILGADLDTTNLARRLRDGEQILIAGPQASTVRLTAGEPLDLNVATQEQLIALPGIGEAYSQRIVYSRLADGPFASVDDVLARGLLPARTLDGIRAMVTVSIP
jgi:competence protein ComEA